MNVFGWVLLLAVAVVVVADARVALRQRQAAPALGPSVAALLLAAFAWLAHAEATGSGRLLLLGLLLTVVAGPYLRRSRWAGPRPGEDGRRTLAAVGTTLLARLLLVASALALPGAAASASAPRALGVVAALAVGGAAVWRLGRVVGDPLARGVVTAYGVLVVGGAALVAWHGVPLAALGLCALAAADLVLGWSWTSRTPVPRAVLVAALVVRHLGTALVVVGVVRPDLGA